jgi:hypothetical protein
MPAGRGLVHACFSADEDVLVTRNKRAAYAVAAGHRPEALAACHVPHLIQRFSSEAEV